MAENQAIGNELVKLEDGLKTMPTSMRFFSLSLRSLYNEHDVGSSSSETVKFNQMRDDTRLDAQVYIKAILPVSSTLVRSLKEFFEYYIELDYDEWAENLDDIIEDVRSFRDCCNEVIKLHKDIMVPLKKRKDEAISLIQTFDSLTMEYEKKVKELKGSANCKCFLALGLLWIPGVNYIACPLLFAGAGIDVASSVAKSSQLAVNQKATLVVRDTMIPALENFTGGLTAAAGFFSVVENELNTLQGKTEKAMEDKKKLHYTMIKKKANEIKSHCQSFFAMIPGVETDLEVIPTQPSDKNYIDKWLDEKKKHIEKKYKNRLTGSLRKMINTMSIGGNNA